MGHEWEMNGKWMGNGWEMGNALYILIVVALWLIFLFFKGDVPKAVIYIYSRYAERRAGKN